MHEPLACVLLTSQSPSAQALKAERACGKGVRLPVKVAACVPLLGNLPKSLFCYLWGHIKWVQGAFPPVCCCHFHWCRTVCGLSLYPCCKDARQDAPRQSGATGTVSERAAGWCFCMERGIHASERYSQSRALPALRRMLMRCRNSLLRSGLDIIIQSKINCDP